MISQVIIAILVVLTIYYVSFLLRVQRGLKNLMVQQDSGQQKPFVSVVIAARNEERTIESCINGILRQRYPTDLYEIIVVDDGSNDRTLSILHHLAASQARIRILSTKSNTEMESVGKPAAISAGVNAARGEIIVTTDADCIVPIAWIGTMVQYLQPPVAFAAGAVRERPNTTFLSKLSALEYLGLITTSAGLIGASRPIICSGANLAYRKSAFLAAQGYGESQTWCDDETLMHRIRERRLGEIAFVASTDALVETSSVNSISSFWKQRLRWSAKGNHYENTGVLLTVIGIYFFFLFLLAAFVGGMFSPTMSLWFVLCMGTKMAFDYSTLAKGARLLNDRVFGLVYLAAEILHVPYVVLTAGIGQFISIQWKGRSINS